MIEDLLKLSFCWIKKTIFKVSKVFNPLLQHYFCYAFACTTHVSSFSIKCMPKKKLNRKIISLKLFNELKEMISRMMLKQKKKIEISSYIWDLQVASYKKKCEKDNLNISVLSKTTNHIILFNWKKQILWRLYDNNIITKLLLKSINVFLVENEK